MTAFVVAVPCCLCSGGGGGGGILRDGTMPGGAPNPEAALPCVTSPGAHTVLA